MLILADLSGQARRRKVSEAVEGVLRQIKEPVTTSELVKAVAVFLGCERETNRIARDVVDLAPSHPLSKETGETFQKYGRTMKRRVWLPSHAKRTSTAKIVLDDAEIQRRRELIAAHEAEDEWTVHPASSDFLEDSD